jgi:hypothetical protein
MVAPSTPGRERDRLRGRLALTASLAFIGLQAALVARAVSERDPLLLVVAVTAATVALSLVGVALFLGPQSRRLRRLRQMFPEAVVIGAQSFTGLGYSIGDILGRGEAAPGTYLGTYFVVVVDDEGIGFWKGGTRPYRKLLVPWDLVADVTTGTLVLARELPSIDVRTRSDTGQSDEIGFCPCREGWLHGFALLHRRDVEVWTERVRTAWTVSSSRPTAGDVSMLDR